MLFRSVFALRGRDSVPASEKPFAWMRMSSSLARVIVTRRVDTAVMLRARGVGETEAAAGMPIEEVLTNAVSATDGQAADTGELRRRSRERR